MTDEELIAKGRRAHAMLRDAAHYTTAKTMRLLIERLEARTQREPDAYRIIWITDGLPQPLLTADPEDVETALKNKWMIIPLYTMPKED